MRGAESYCVRIAMCWIVWGLAIPFNTKTHNPIQPNQYHAIPTRARAQLKLEPGPAPELGLGLELELGPEAPAVARACDCVVARD